MNRTLGRTFRSAACAACMVVPSLQFGCASDNAARDARSQASTFLAENGDYADWFESAKDELRAAGFELARVDAREGVITTRPRASAGFATPWTSVESTFAQSLDGTFNAYRRTAEVRFRPEAGVVPDDLRTCHAPLVGAVTVVVQRVARPHTRVSSTSVRLTSRPEHAPSERSPTEAPEPSPQQDAALADRLRDSIVRRHS